MSQKALPTEDAEHLTAEDTEYISPAETKTDLFSTAADLAKKIKFYKFLKKAEDQCLGVAVGFGGSLLFFLADVLKNGQIMNNTILFLGALGFVFFMAAIMVHYRARKIFRGGAL